MTKIIITTLTIIICLIPLGAKAETTISVPSDLGAKYFLINKAKLPNGNLQVVTKRMGPSGTSFARREINCRNMTFRYTGEGDSIAELNSPYEKGAMGKLTPKSISTYIAQATCRSK